MYYRGKKIFNVLKPVIVDYEEAIGFAEEERQKSQNLFYAPSRTNTMSGLTYTVNDTNQTITINGTSTEPNEARIAPIVPFVCKAGKTYTFSVNFISGSSLYGVRLYLYNEATGLYTNNFGLAFSNNLTKVTKTFTEDTTFNAIRRYTTQNDVFENFVIKIQVEENSTQSDWQPYNGAIVHEKQLNEQIETREILYDMADNVISISSSSLTTLQEYYDLFKKDISKTYICNVGEFNTDKFKGLVGNPAGFGNYTQVAIKQIDLGDKNDVFRTFEVIAYANYSNKIAKGYIFRNVNGDVVFTGWTIF